MTLNYYSAVLGFHILKVLSSEPLTTSFPSLVNPPQVMDASCPAKTPNTSPFTPFHIHSVASSPPANTTKPLGCQSNTRHSDEHPSNFFS